MSRTTRRIQWTADNGGDLEAKVGDSCTLNVFRGERSGYDAQIASESYGYISDNFPTQKEAKAFCEGVVTMSQVCEVDL
jgi:hypothetical protein